MAIEVFNRFENKYMLNQKVLEKVQTRLSEYMELDSNNEKQDTYTISNLYYDTQDNYLIRTSLQKPNYKEKLRMRSYGVPKTGDKVYVEIKKKVAGLVNKRRSALILSEAYDFLETGRIPDTQAYQNRQVLSEISYMLETHDLRPTLYLAYDRRAYLGTGQSDLRISFDCNIRTRRCDLSLETGDYGSPLLDNDQWLMEVKSAGSIPMWLSSLLSEYKIYPTSFSKYGVEYMKTIVRKEQSIIYSYQSEITASHRKIAVAI